MRLASAILIAVATLALGGLTTPAHAQLTVRGNYWRDRNTRVLAPEVIAAKELPSGTTIEAGYLLDAITSASVAAGVISDQPFTELRNQFAIGIGQRVGPLTLGASYRYSTESDYWAHVFGGSATLELFEKNTILSVGYSHNLSTVGARMGPTGYILLGKLDANYLTFSLSQVLSKRLVLELVGELSREGNHDTDERTDGQGPQLPSQCYQSDGKTLDPNKSQDRDCLPEMLSNAYRTVQVAGTNTREQEPGQRQRLTVTGALRYAIPLRMGWLHYVTFLGKYRFYVDDWGVRSQAPELRMYVGLGPFEVRVTGRYYTQTGADFWRSDVSGAPSYTMPVAFDGRPVYTGDAKLSPFSSVFTEWRLSVPLRFLDVPRMPLGPWLGAGTLSASFGYYINDRYAYRQFGNAYVAGIELVLPL